jgi:hypothetical protein
MPSIRSRYDDDGSLVRIVDYDAGESPYDRVIIRIPTDQEIIAVQGFEGDEQTYQDAFEIRDLSFDPISLLGRGETDRLTGTSTDDHESVPTDVSVALNGMGFTVVPSGREWLDV